MARIDPEDAKVSMITRSLWPIADFRNTQEKWLCVCMECGDLVSPRYNNVVNKGAGGCKRCGSRRGASKQKLDAAAAKARMIEKGVWPISAFVKTLAPWLCVCMTCGEFVFPTYGSVVTSGYGGCKYCAVASKTMDSAAAKERMIASGVWPVADFKNTSNPWLCVCMTCGRFVKPRYNSVIHKGHGGCQFCGRREVDPRHAKAVMIAHNLWPISSFPGTSGPWLCVCMKCGEFVNPRYGGTAYRGSTCKFCAGKAVDPETAKARMIAKGYWPIAVFAGARAPWLCVCMECGTFNSPRYSSIVSDNQGGCSQCSTSGFRDDAPALIYLMVHDARGSAKVGICNVGTGRIEKHERNGWVLFDTHTFDLGVHARDAERATLTTWRSRGEDWKAALLPDEDKYDGFSETVSLVRADGHMTDPAQLWDDVLNSIKRLGL
ncbi:hypothetical protein ACFCXT_17145 [Streptomyces vinaceus]|uniref:hypothetical protein n=1 Tax=Streptomyces vinaceus TaxID=1960 RepID=UPI0035DAD3C7